MTTRQTPEVLIARDEIVAAPTERACTDQSFELPSGLYLAMASMFAGFIAVLGLSFRGGHLSVVYGVIAAFIAAFFAIPALFPAMASSASRSQALGWYSFRTKGLQTATGHSSAGEATILVLLLPFLILCFGMFVAIIAAVVN